jgi:hypothetical protein
MNTEQPEIAGYRILALFQGIIQVVGSNIPH